MKIRHGEINVVQLFLYGKLDYLDYKKKLIVKNSKIDFALFIILLSVDCSAYHNKLTNTK